MSEQATRPMTELSPPQDFDEAKKYYKEVRRTYLSEFESDTERLDMQRVAKFLEDYGMKQHALVVTTSEKYHDVRSGFEDPEGVFLDPRPFDVAWSLPFLRISNVLRDRMFEQLNGEVTTEGIIIHELVHTCDPRYYTIWDYDNETSRAYIGEIRMGFRILDPDVDSGQFLEEMRAQYYASEYISLNSTQTWHEESEDVTSWPTVPTTFGELPIRPAGIMLDPRASEDAANFLKVDYVDGIPLIARPSQIAGTAMKILALASPELEQVLDQGLVGVDGLRRAIPAINRLETGLYRKLRDVSYEQSEDCFDVTAALQGLKIVCDAVDIDTL